MEKNIDLLIALFILLITVALLYVIFDNFLKPKKQYLKNPMLNNFGFETYTKKVFCISYFNVYTNHGDIKLLKTYRAELIHCPSNEKKDIICELHIKNPKISFAYDNISEMENEFIIQKYKKGFDRVKQEFNFYFKNK